MSVRAPWMWMSSKSGRISSKGARKVLLALALVMCLLAAVTSWLVY